jgi:hypothetical protein
MVSGVLPMFSFSFASGAAHSEIHCTSFTGMFFATADQANKQIAVMVTMSFITPSPVSLVLPDGRILM